MTNEQLLEGIARAIENESRLIQLDIIDNKSPTPESLSTLYAKAVIDHLSPMMREVVGTFKKCDDLFYEIRNDWSDPRSECREGRDKIGKALESLPECWRGGEK